MDLEEQQELHAAAQAEASDLVWKHQNPNAPYPYSGRYGPGNYSKRFSTGTRSIGDLQSSMKKTRGNGGSSRSVSESSSGSSRVPSDSSVKSVDSRNSNGRKRSVQFAVEDRVVEIEKESPAPTNKPAAGLPNSSTGSVAAHPSSVAPMHSRNPFSRVRNSRQSLNQSATTSPAGLFWKAREEVEIQNNPPSRSRNPYYTTNPATGSILELCSTTPRDDAKMKDGKEIRGDDIRKATSMSLRDRSPKLPTPAMVSDKPGRPIVSFDPNWRPREVQVQEEKKKEDFKPVRPVSMIDVPRPGPQSQISPIPIINLPDEGPPRRQQTQPRPPIPVINLPDDMTAPPQRCMPSLPTISIDPSPPPQISRQPSAPTPLPTIAVNDSPTDGPSHAPRSTRPLPTPTSASRGSRATHSPALPRSRTIGGGTIRCHACALPIDARFVTAAGARFHPACFRCFRCAEHLECVAFYPEPGDAQAKRAAEEGTGVVEEGDLRFYCHLDFHELFSPRCKSCKTPIEGEVVVACGAEWHVGHFFCAQCGDVCDFSIVLFLMLTMIAVRRADAVCGEGWVCVVRGLPHQALLDQVQEVPEAGGRHGH
jgi:paxillin